MVAPISMFSPQQLQTVIDQTLATVALPAGHQNAIVGTVDQQGAKAIAVFKLGPNDDWLFQGAFTHEWATNDNKVGASLLYSW